MPAFIPPPQNLPAGYRHAGYWQLSAGRGRLIAINLASFAMFGAAVCLFGWLAVSLGRLPQNQAFTPGTFLLLLAGVFLTLILHELAHALPMRFCGGRPVFGFLPRQLLLTTSAPGFAFPRGRYLITLLTPFVGLSLLCMVAMLLLTGTAWAALPAFCAALNIASSAGDLWLAALALRSHPRAYFLEERDGVHIFLPEES